MLILHTTSVIGSRRDVVRLVHRNHVGIGLVSTGYGRTEASQPFVSGTSIIRWVVELLAIVLPRNIVLVQSVCRIGESEDVIEEGVRNGSARVQNESVLHRHVAAIRLESGIGNVNATKLVVVTAVHVKTMVLVVTTQSTQCLIKAVQLIVHVDWSLHILVNVERYLRIIGSEYIRVQYTSFLHHSS